MVGKFYLVVGNACTLVPTIFRWHGKREFKWNFHFSFSHDIEKQIWVLLFVFRFRPTLKNGFELRIFRFSFSQNFEKRLWISVFVFRLIFASLWKTDMLSLFVLRFRITLKADLNFVSRFLITLTNRSEFRLSFLHDLKNRSLHQGSHLKPRPPPRGWPGHSWIFLSPGTKWVANFPPPPPQWYVLHTHGTPFFNNGWQMIWW